MLLVGIAGAVVWSLFWKGWGMWVAGRRNEMPWFVVFFLINTLGILEIVYLYGMNKRKLDGEKQTSKR